MAEIPKQKPAILIIDDDEQIRKLLKTLLCAESECTTVGSAEEALAVLDTSSFELVISDINMGGISGLDLVPKVLEKDADSVVVMISGQQTIDFAIEAMRVGAFDYITKPLDIRHVEAAVRRALAQRELLRERRLYENHLEELVKERTAKIEHLAYYDRLTNLPNRTLFVDRCTRAMSSTAKHNKHPAGIVLVSIDRFKNINDTLGHISGDRLLIEVATRLQRCIGTGDTLARFEGAEFAFLFDGVASADDLTEASLSISETLSASFQLGAQEVYITASLGISLFPTNGDDSTAILKNAGAALHRAKKQGGNNHQFYSADMNALALNRLALETSLRHAIDNQEFITYYQPVVNLESNQIVGLEALVRWQHPRLGVLPPSEFLGLAEDTGLILNISESVMRSACVQTRKWQLQGRSDLRIAVNVSARQFQQRDFIDRVVHILEESGLGASYLELELTETSIMENPESAAKLLTEIRQLGVKVAVDDFGTGYSSLSYLKRLPIDTLKVDRSFVNNAPTDPDDAALVMAIVTLAHNLRLRVVAEGIETDEQLSFLRLLRCDEGQGYLFSRPQPAEALEQSLLEDSPPPTATQQPLVSELPDLQLPPELDRLPLVKGG
jgi:diguanylate cyclase (GGDEF)-like protein